MTNLHKIRARIRSVNSTQQITRTMKMIAVSKLRKTQTSLAGVRLFADKGQEVLNALLAGDVTFEHPYLTPRRRVGHVCYVVFWGNRGLCGAYNQVLLRHLEQLVHAETRPCSVIVCGRWGRDVLAGTDLPVREICAGLSDTPTMAEALEIAETLKNLYRTGEADEIHLVYQRFDSVLHHRGGTAAGRKPAGGHRLPVPAVPGVPHSLGAGGQALPLRESADGGGLAAGAVPGLRHGRDVSVPEPVGKRGADLGEKLFRSVKDLEKAVIALGFFDGVHRGHGALLEKTAERARELQAVPTAFTFDRPPKEVVTGQPVYLINSSRDRQGLMERLYGIERVVFAPFDRQMMTMPWEEYIGMLLRDYGAVHFVAGHDHRFGHKNAGNVQLLQEKCAQLGIGCDIIPPVQRDGITVSSTYIRTLVEAGDMERAAEFLGHRHCLSQTVQHGQRIGRTIGIPTVNLAVPEHVLAPAHGVYVTCVYLPDGRMYHGVTNVGTRPTVTDGDAVSVETFLLGFDGDLYGQEIRIEFCRRLRGEKKFASLEELRQEIQHNIRETERYFGE